MNPKPGIYKTWRVVSRLSHWISYVKIISFRICCGQVPHNKCEYEFSFKLQLQVNANTKLSAKWFANCTAATWPGMLHALCQCIVSEVIASKKRGPKPALPKILRNFIQKAEDTGRSGEDSVLVTFNEKSAFVSLSQPLLWCFVESWAASILEWNWFFVVVLQSGCSRVLWTVESEFCLILFHSQTYDVAQQVCWLSFSGWQGKLTSSCAKWRNCFNIYLTCFKQCHCLDRTMATFCAFSSPMSNMACGWAKRSTMVMMALWPKESFQ